MRRNPLPNPEPHQMSSLSHELRASLIRVLDGQTENAVLEGIAALVVRRRPFRRYRLAPVSPELLAAVPVLAGASRLRGDAARALQLARTAADPQVRLAAFRA
jgi:hypothetical protein